MNKIYQIRQAGDPKNYGRVFQTGVYLVVIGNMAVLAETMLNGKLVPMTFFCTCCQKSSLRQKINSTVELARSEGLTTKVLWQGHPGSTADEINPDFFEWAANEYDVEDGPIKTFLADELVQKIFSAIPK